MNKFVSLFRNSLSIFNVFFCILTIDSMKSETILGDLLKILNCKAPTIYLLYIAYSFHTKLLNFLSLSKFWRYATVWKFWPCFDKLCLAVCRSINMLLFWDKEFLTLCLKMADFKAKKTLADKNIKMFWWWDYSRDFCKALR